MRTPELTDVEGNSPDRQSLARIAKMPSLRGAGLLRAIGEDIIREGEDARLIFVRGTYYRRDAIEEIVRHQPDWVFTLAAEPENEADPFAVAVHLDGERIGYLPRELAIDFQSRVLARLCRVAARGFFQRDGDSFSVALLIAWSAPVSHAA